MGLGFAEEQRQSLHGHGLMLGFLLRQEGTLDVHERSGLKYDSRHQTAQDGHGHYLDAWWQRGRGGNTGNRSQKRMRISPVMGEKH